jgi:predicted 2-oxoglutarate/Fe(II)-dependent dioxygenase YbiX
MTEEIGVRPLGYGELARLFTGALDIAPRYNFGAAGGRWVVLQFLIRLRADIARDAHQVILDSKELFNDTDACYFGVSIDPEDFATGPRTSLPGRRYYQDFDEEITKLHGLKIPGGYHPMTILLDRSMRVVAAEPLRRTGEVLALMRRCIEEERATLADQPAPVLTVPRIFEPAFCKTLIDYYIQDGGSPSGFMRQIDGKTVGAHDPKYKRRRDTTIEDEDLRNQAVTRISRRLLPAIEQAFNWRGTRIERYIVACYSSEDQGFFNRHRDNTTSGTAHRKFAVTINLNADEYEGGELCFPEFGPRTYKPPTGGATVFSCSLLHEATPVTKGARYAFLPFLYDEESKLIRDRNADTIKWNEPAKAEG